ncbi:MAG: hypothetical protein ACI9UA_003415 [Pseudoalteromonas tetraodonis]|jgi:hypothetical protein
MPLLSPTSENQYPKRSASAALVALVVGAVFLVVLMQGESGRYFSKTASLDREIKGAKPSGDHGFRVTLPKAFRNDPRVAEQAVLLEDGVPLPLRIEKIKHVGAIGNGRYRITQKGIYFSAPDNSDPGANGRTYRLSAPRSMKPAVTWGSLVLFSGALFCLMRWGVPRRSGWQVRPWVEPVLVLSISLAAMLWSLNHYADYSDGWLIVKGVPYSDGIGWVELGKSLSEGRGFSGGFGAHRGGYPILLGSFFSLVGGASVFLAKLFNVLMLGIGATAIYLLARSAFGRGLAVIALLGLLLGTRFGVLSQMTLTEPVGFALAAIGLQQLHRALSEPATWRFLVVGVFLGLSNLVRPFTLLALPIFGALILWLAWRQRWGWRRFAIAGVAYVGGAMLIFGPWVARQKADWGVATLDLNSAVMLYGAAAKPPEGGKQMLAARHYREGDAAGFARYDHGPRYHYYMDQYKASVAEDHSAYFAFIRSKFVEFFSAPGFGDGHVREQLGVVFFCALVVVAWRRRLPPLVLLAGFWPWIGAGIASAPPLLVVLTGAAVGFALSRGAARLAIALLLATLCGAGVLNAMVGNFALNRGTVFIEWMVFLLVAGGMFAVARFAAGDRKAVVEKPAPDRFSDGYPLVLLSIFLAGFLLLVAKSMFAAKPDIASWQLAPGVKAAVCAEVLKHHPGVVERDLFVSRVRLGGYRWFVADGEDLGHWSRQFEVRAFDRTIAIPLTGYFAESLGVKSVDVNLPGDQRGLDGDRDFILAGLRNVDEHAELAHATLIVESLVLIPYDPDDEELDLGSAIHFERPPDF